MTIGNLIQQRGERHGEFLLRKVVLIRDNGTKVFGTLVAVPHGGARPSESYAIVRDSDLKTLRYRGCEVSDIKPVADE